MTSRRLLSLLQLRQMLKPERLVTLHSDEEDKLLSLLSSLCQIVCYIYIYYTFKFQLL